MKVDKDALLKQKFWILLGVFALLWLIGLLVLYANAGGPLETAQKNFDTAKKAISTFTGDKRPKNPSFLPPWQDYFGLFEKHKNTVWGIAWNGDKADDADTPSRPRWEGQKGIYTWPHSNEFPLQDELLFPDSMKADGKTPVFDVDRRQWYKSKDAYDRQFETLDAALKGEPGKPNLDAPLRAVDFKGDFNTVMQPVDWEKSTRPPDVEECWLAQEDFWVKRELLYTVQAALALAARFDAVDADFEKIPVPAEGKLGRRVFRNGSWEVQLLFDKGPNGTRISPASTIKNVHVSHRDQKLGTATNRGVWFQLLQNGQEVRKFNLVGEKLPWGASSTFGNDGAKDGFDLISADPARPMELVQIFERADTPIVAIDEIKIPYVSHRNANRPLVPTKPERYGKRDAVVDPTKPPVAGAPPVPGAPLVGNGGMPSGSMPMSVPGGQTGASGQTVDDLTSNKTLNIHRNRYLFVTDQSRHLPVALTLTIDQSHLGDVLVAAANSRLRFQTTQVEFRRDHTTGPGGPAGGERGAPGMPLPAGSTGAPMPMPMPMPMPLTGPGTPGGAAAAPAAVDEGNPNLVEVTIYGIASLYERPRPTETGAGK